MKTTYTLQEPKQFGDRTISELEITRPTPRLLKKYDMSSLNMGDMIKIAAECANEPPSLIENLELPDYMGVIKILEDWFREAAGTK